MSSHDPSRLVGLGERPSLAVDMDEVLVDTHARTKVWLEDSFGYEPLIPEGTPLSRALPSDQYAALVEMYNEGSFFGDLPPMAGSIDGLQQLCTYFDVYVCTAAMEHPGSFAPKFSWLRRWVPFVDPLRIVFCGDKSIIGTDYLLDDNARHFTRFRGHPVLFTAPHNLGEEGYDRVADWEETVSYFIRRISPDPA